MFIAKPNLGNSRGEKVFHNKEEAVKYLEEMTGFEFPYPVPPSKLPKNPKKLMDQFGLTPEDRVARIKNNEVTYPDWELLGKLKRK